MNLDDSSLTIYCNGLGLEEIDSQFKGIISSLKKQTMIFDSVRNDPNLSQDAPRWTPSPELIALPYLWCRSNNLDRHHFGDVLRVIDILAAALGYESSLDYVRTRGWTCKRDEANPGNYTLRYRRLQECFQQRTPTQTLHTLHLHEMLLALYKRLSLAKTRNHFGGSLPLKYMAFSSFIQKINSHSQDLHIALAIVQNYFLPFATEKRMTLGSG